MVIRMKAEGFQQFKTILKEIESKHTSSDVYILFSGSKDESGNSWCPDCVEGTEKLLHFRAFYILK